jgi:hypothetical protein
MEYQDYPAIVGPTYTLASLNAECQRCVNLQVETIESGKGANEYYLRETPGLKDFFSEILGLVPTPITGMFTSANGRCFFSAQNALYELLSDKTSVGLCNIILGGTGTPFPPLTVSFSETNFYLYWVVDGYSCALDSGKRNLGRLRYSDNADHPIKDVIYPGFTGGQTLQFLNQRLITISMRQGVGDTAIASTQFQISDTTDVDGLPQTWQAINVFDADSTTDTIVQIKVCGNELWVFGRSSYEVWFDTGDISKLFKRISGAAYNIGCGARNSVSLLGGHLFWLGSSLDGDGIVWKSSGTNAERISTTAIEKIIKSVPVLDDAYSLVYQVSGHFVYILTLPSAGVTLAYDLSTGFWNERSYRDPETSVYSQYRMRFSTFCFGKNLMSDAKITVNVDDPTVKYAHILELSETTYVEEIDNFSFSTGYFPTPIVRYRRSPAISSGQRDIFYHKLELQMQAGVGIGTYSDDPRIDTALRDDPEISIRWSDDNGYTWGNYHTTKLGKLGDYGKRVIFNRLGKAQNRVFEVYMDAPVPFRLISGELGITIGTN